MVPLNNEKRADRILIGIAFLAILLAVGGFYFDDWMWGSKGRRGNRIGVIVSRTGDVRMKFDNDLKWQRANDGQGLVYNDAVYAGAGGQAVLQVGASRLTVTENTLIVLRRNQDISFLNINYGTFFGKVKKSDKLLIDTGDGKPITLNSTKDSNIVVRRSEGKTRLDVTSGEALVSVSGQQSRLDKSTRLVVGDKSPAQLHPAHLRILKPLKDQVLASDNPSEIDFAWEWDNGKAVPDQERFVLEFSSQPSFQRIHATKTVEGALNTGMSVSRTLSLYYRVRGPGGEVSPPEQVHFVRLESPMILKPLPDTHYEAMASGQGSVDFEFQKPNDQNMTFEISDNPEFRKVLLSEDVKDYVFKKKLPTGRFYVRARTEYSGFHSQWSEARVFNVDRPLEVLKLANHHLPARVQIPNRPYPRELYSASPGKIKSFLANHGLLRRYFAFDSKGIDELTVAIDEKGKKGKTELFVQTDSSWPVSKLAPGQYEYRVMAKKEGFKPSAWSAPKNLEIFDEPPKPQGEVVYGQLNESGMRSATWNFTPLLFAETYDIEISDSPTFQHVLELSSVHPWADTELAQGKYYWRVRARDASGRIISPFSPAYKLKSMPEAVPQFLAKEPMDRAIKRHPADAVSDSGSLSAHVNEVREQAFVKNGWWAWVGTGENYVDYKQSMPGVSTLDAFHRKGPSQYFETGYTADSGIGGLISYQSTPGEFQLSDSSVPIVPNTYRWTTFSVEATSKKESSLTVGDSPIIYGLRAGVQRHQIPFLFLNADGSALELKNNRITTASLGLIAELTKRNWTYYWLSRYQFPFKSSADGASQFSTTPVFAFDGSLGAAYHMTQQLKLGLFWYGQWHQFNFVYGDGTVTNSGFQSLFYSALDLRLGMDF